MHESLFFAFWRKQSVKKRRQSRRTVDITKERLNESHGGGSSAVHRQRRGAGSDRLVGQAFVIADGFGIEEFLPFRGDGFVGEDVADVLKIGEFGKG